MDTKRLSITESSAIVQAVEVLQAGMPIAFPTDTVYGVGALAWDEEAVCALYRAKEREASKAIPLLIASPSHLATVAVSIPPVAWLLARRFWPGPLTLVFRKVPRIPPAVTGGGETVAIRVLDHPFVLRLIRALGAPLAATSANRSGEPSLTTPEEVMDQLGGRIPLLLDGGPSSGDLPSTVLDLTTGQPTLLRRGLLGPDDWRDLLTGGATSRKIDPPLSSML